MSHTGQWWASQQLSTDQKPESHEHLFLGEETRPFLADLAYKPRYDLPVRTVGILHNTAAIVVVRAGSNRDQIGRGSLGRVSRAASSCRAVNLVALDLDAVPGRATETTGRVLIPVRRGSGHGLCIFYLAPVPLSGHFLCFCRV